MTSTDPNRYYMWTGWVGNDGNGGGPVIDNAETGYSWSTYPEVLQAAGISWRVYQDIGIGLDAKGAWGLTQDRYIGNYGCNSRCCISINTAMHSRAHRFTRTRARARTWR
jgi:phospholipase C